MVEQQGPDKDRRQRTDKQREKISIKHLSEEEPDESREVQQRTEVVKLAIIVIAALIVLSFVFVYARELGSPVSADHLRGIFSAVGGGSPAAAPPEAKVVFDAYLQAATAWHKGNEELLKSMIQSFVPLLAAVLGYLFGQKK